MTGKTRGLETILTPDEPVMAERCPPLAEHRVALKVDAIIGHECHGVIRGDERHPCARILRLEPQLRRVREHVKRLGLGVCVDCRQIGGHGVVAVQRCLLRPPVPPQQGSQTGLEQLHS